MMLKTRYYLLFLLLAAAPCFASGGSTPSSSEIAIHTYGGGELLEKIFNSISMVIYGNGNSGIDKTFNGILRIAMAVGGVCTISLAFFRSSFEPIFKSFFLPSVAVLCCLLVPRTTVYIQDHLTIKASSPQTRPFIAVDNTPFFLGKVASLVSSVSYRLTNLMESVSHGTNDTLYNWTGHIYAGDNIFQTKKCRIANPVLEDNFRIFCRECVFRDLGLGLYSKGDLVNSPNILGFLEKNTSQIRTMSYRDSSKENGSEGSFIPCREAIKKMNLLFDSSTGNTKEILLGEIGDDFNFLVQSKNGGQTDLRHLIKQQMAIQLLKEEIPGTLSSFASKRAELLQRENQKILGALGASSIVAMRNFFEATIYMVFPLIIVVSLLSFGLKPLINWTHFVLWINTWPPFYVVVKFLLSSIWEFRTRHMFGEHYALTIFTSDGLSDLYGSMESIAAVAMAFIPFLSWILLKGGVSQMVQLASSIMSPAQSAASTAAAEKTYGNYSVGNLNIDNVNGYNAQTFRQTYSGLLSTGSFAIDGGTETTTYTPQQNGLYVRQSDSHLREGVSRTHAFTSAIQESLNTSQSSLVETSKGLSHNLSDTSNKAVGVVQALSTHFQTGENVTTQEMTGLQEAVQYMEGVGSDYAHSKGVSYDQALKELFSGGIGFSLGLKATAEGSYQDGVSKSESVSDVEKAFNSEMFQKHLQTITNASHSEIGAVLKGEDLRLHEDFSQAFNATKTSSEQWRAALTSQEAFSHLKNDAESHNLAVHQNLNQRFVEFLQERYHDSSQIHRILEMPSETGEKQALIQQFVSSLIPQRSLQSPSLEKHYDDASRKIPLVDERGYQEKSSYLWESQEQVVGTSRGESQKGFERLSQRVSQDRKTHSQRLSDNSKTTALQHNERRSSSIASLEKHLAHQFVDASTGMHFLKSSLRINSRTIATPLLSNYIESVHQELYGNRDDSSK